MENGNGYGTWTLPLRLNALAHYPTRAGVGAGLADLSLRDQTRRVFLAGYSGAPAAQNRRMLSAAHHQIIPVHHLGAAAEPED